MFVVDTAVLLPHPPRRVAQAAARLDALPRWCAGLRRAGPAAPDADAAGRCAFTYAAADVRLALRAHTRVHGATVEHVAVGDGVRLCWTLAAAPEPAAAGPGAAAGIANTRLRARVTLEVDPAHPTAAVRPALCRALARRAPADLERLRALLARVGERRRAGPAPSVLGEPAGALPSTPPAS